MSTILKKVTIAGESTRQSTAACRAAAASVLSLTTQANAAFAKAREGKRPIDGEEAIATLPAVSRQEESDTWNLMESIATMAIEMRAKYPSGMLRFVALGKSVGDLASAILQSEGAVKVRQQAIKVAAIAACLADEWTYEPKNRG